MILRPQPLLFGVMKSHHVSFTWINLIVLALISLCNFSARATEYRVISQSGVNVRQGPGTQYKIIGTASYDKIVSGDTIIQGWIRIAHPSLPLQGYIKADLLEYADFNPSIGHTFIIYPIITLITFILGLIGVRLFKNFRNTRKKNSCPTAIEYKVITPQQKAAIMFCKSARSKYISESAFTFFENLAEKLYQRYTNQIKHDISSSGYWYIEIPHETRIKHYAILLDLEHKCTYISSSGEQKIKHIDLAILLCQNYQENTSTKYCKTLLHIEIDGNQHYTNQQIKSDMWRNYYAAINEHVPTIHIPNQFTNNTDTTNTIVEIIQTLVNQKLIHATHAAS